MIKITIFAILVSFIVFFASSSVRAGGGGAGGDPAVTLDGVLDLTPENFNEYIGSDKAALVEFYAPWCGHCKNLVPELAKLGKAVKGNSKVIVAKVNADAHGSIGSKYGVQGFPTIKFFPAGSASATPEEYNSGRDAKSFIKFLNEKTNAGLFLPYEHSDVKNIAGLAQHDQIVGDKSKKITFVKYFAPWCGHCKAMAPAWNSLAGIFKNEKAVTIADCDADQEINKPVASKVGVQGFPTIKYYVEGGAAQEYNGGRTLEDLVAFVNEKAGTSRAIDGGLASTAGVTSELSDLASQFMAASAGADRAAIQAKITAAAGSDASLDWFNKIAAAVIAKGDSYVEAEAARVSKMLNGGNLAAAKRDSLSLKKNALAAFKKA